MRRAQGPELRSDLSILGIPRGELRLLDIYLFLVSSITFPVANKTLPVCRLHIQWHRYLLLYPMTDGQSMSHTVQVGVPILHAVAHFRHAFPQFPSVLIFYPLALQQSLFSSSSLSNSECIIQKSHTFHLHHERIRASVDST